MINPETEKGQQKIGNQMASDISISLLLLINAQLSMRNRWKGNR
jgi:hypothetical protein